MHIKRLLVVLALSAALLAVVLLLNLSVQAAPLPKLPAAPPWNASVRVNDTASAEPTARSAPAFAARDSANTLYAVWQDARNDDGDIYSAQSADAGQTWTYLRRVNSDAPGGVQTDPDVAINAAGTLHVVWEDYGLYYARSTDGGRTWSTATKISDATGAAYDPAIAVYTNMVCAAWVDSIGIRMDCSTDNGVSWDTDLTAPAVSGANPDLVVDSTGQAHVVWTDNRNGNADIYYARWSPGKSWSGATRLNTDAGSAVQQYPSIALNGNALVVGWQDQRSGTQIYARYSANLGTAWSASDAQVSDVGNVIGAPAFTAGRSGLWATWIVLSGTDYIAYADTGTSTWGTDAAITTTTQVRQDIAAAGNTSYVWVGWAQDNAIWNVARSTSWGTPYQASNAGEATQLYPAMGAANNGDLFAVWNDNRSAPGLYTARSTDGGSTWGTNNLVSGSGDAGQPALVVTGTSTLHVAWRQEDYNYWRIYYNRSVDGGSSWLLARAVVSYIVPHRPTTGASPQVESPDVAVLGNNVYLSWAAEGALYLARSTDGGASWGHPTNVFTQVNGTLVTAQGKVAVTAYSSGRVYLAWDNYGTGDYGICAAYSTDSGATWSAANRMCVSLGGATRAQNPAVAIMPPGDSAVIAWNDNRSGVDHIHSTIWSALGVSPVITIDNGVGPATFPDLVIAADGAPPPYVVHATWQDARNGNDDIYWSRSNDGGSTWTTFAKVNDDMGTYPQQRPVLAANAAYDWAKLWIAWQDFRRTNWDVYATTITGTCAAPLTGVGISGSTSTLEGQQVVLSSYITPTTATLPVTYQWLNPPNAVYTTTTATYTWATYGDQPVELTVQNCGGSVAKTHTVQVMCDNPIITTSIAGNISVWANRPLTLTAVITPAAPHEPVVMQWSPEPETGQGTLQAIYQLTTLGYQNITFTASSCGGTWGGLVSDTHRVLVYDSAGPTWGQDFTPGYNTWFTASQTVPFSITVRDGNSGLDVNSAEAAYSTDYGLTYSAWEPISCTGAAGTTITQTVFGQHNFGQDSGKTYRNWLKVRIRDIAGNYFNPGAEPARRINIDTVPPTNLSNLTFDRPVATWSTDPLLDVWGDHGYDESNNILYYYAVTSDPNTTPNAASYSTSSNYFQTGIPGDGQNWYLHIRSRDWAGWWATETVHVGPFWLDVDWPDAPTIVSVNPITGWTNIPTATVHWTMPAQSGSNIVGFSYLWDYGAGGLPDGTVDPVLQSSSEYYTTSLPFTNGTQQNYFHVKAIDAAGNQGIIASVGPWKIDQTAPQAPIGGWADRPPEQWGYDNTIVMTWPRPADGYGSGVNAYSFVFTTTSGTVPDTTPEITGTAGTISTTSAALGDGAWFFYIRARDAASNWSAPAQYGMYYIDNTPPPAPVIIYSSPITGEWSTDKTVLVRWNRPPADAGGLPDAYSYHWDHSPTTTPDDDPDYWTTNATINTTSDPLPNGNNHYFHVRAKDPAGNWGPAAHIGPFMIDATPPLLLADHGSGSAGSDVMLTGLVFPADVTVTLSFTRTLGNPIELGRFHTSYDGTFQVLATVPINATEDEHAFIAEGGGKTGRAPFVVTHGMDMAIQPASVKIRDGGTAPTVTVTLNNLNPDAAVVIETDWGTFKGPYPLIGTHDLSKSVTVPKTTISGTHTLTATARVAGVAVQRQAATFTVTWQTASIITESFISLNTIHGERGTVFTVHGHNSWVNAEIQSEDEPNVKYMCPPNYQEISGLYDFSFLPEEYGGCPLFEGYHLEFDGRTSMSDVVDVYGSGYFEGQTHVPDGWFDARSVGHKWQVENEVPWGATRVCLVATISGKRPDMDITVPNGDTVHHAGEPWTEKLNIACAPFTVDPPTPTFSAQYKLMDGNQPVPLTKGPRIVVDGRSVGERGLTPPTVKQPYTTSNVNVPIGFTIPEGSYLVSAYACNYQPVPDQLTRGRGNQGLTEIPMHYTPFAGPAVLSLQPGIETFLYPGNPDRIGPLLSFDGVTDPPSVDLPISIEIPVPPIATVTQVSATINGVPPYVVEAPSNNKRVAKWHASLLPPGELTLLVQLKGHYEAGQGDCGTTDSWGPISQKTIVMAATPPWLRSSHATVSELVYYPDLHLYHMAGVLNGSVSIGDGEGTDLGFLGKLKNYLIASTDVSQDFYVITSTWTAQAKVTGGVSLMCLTSVMGDCSKNYFVNLVAEPAGNTIQSASDAAFPAQYHSAPPTYRAYEYNIDPIEVYNGIIASYWGIVNVHLSINFGAGATLDVAPGLQSDLEPQMTFIPAANINVPISLWVDILLGAASAGVDAIPSVTLSMPVTVSPSGVDMHGPDVCFRLSGRVWVEMLFWDASFGPFDLFQYGSCALQALLQAVTTTPPPSTLPAPALATDGYGHVLGAWVHNDSNHPSQNQGKLYSVYFDGANWGTQQPVAGDANLLVTDPAIAFAGENEAVAVFATNAPNSTQPLTWTTVTQQMSNQKVSYSIYNGTSWTTATTLATGGGPHGRVTIAGDPYRGRAIAMWTHDATGSSDVKRWEIMYAVYDAETNQWSSPAVVDDSMPDHTVDAEVSLAFDSTGQATAIWVRQAGVESSSVITSPFTKNDLRTLVTANWHPNDPSTWIVTAQPVGLPVGALMPDIAFDDNDQPVVAYALHQKDRDGKTATGFGNNAYLGYAIGTATTTSHGPQTAQAFTWSAHIVPGVKGVEQPRVAMLPDDQALVTYRGFGAMGTADYAGVLMGSTIDLRYASSFRASDATAMVYGNSWMNDALTTRTRADGAGTLEPRLFTVGAFNLGGQTVAVRMSGASLRQINLAGADPVLMTQVPVLPDLSIAPADMVLSETLPVSGTLVPYTVTVRNLGLARNHQPVTVELIQDPGSLRETFVASGTVPIDLMFNETYVLTGTWQAIDGMHVWLARVKPPIDDDVDGDNNETTILVGVPGIPDQLVGNLSGSNAGLAWLPVTGAAMSHYRVYRAEGTGDFVWLADSIGTRYTDGTLQRGVTYRYAVSAVSTAGVGSPLSNELTLTFENRVVYLPLVLK